MLGIVTLGSGDGSFVFEPAIPDRRAFTYTLAMQTGSIKTAERQEAQSKHGYDLSTMWKSVVDASVVALCDGETVCTTSINTGSTKIPHSLDLRFLNCYRALYSASVSLNFVYRHLHPTSESNCPPTHYTRVPTRNGLLLRLIMSITLQSLFLQAQKAPAKSKSKRP
ncbi:hypothetical protein NEUTE2DRAFT_126139 [Neurospora tetrasperma FGSC 2509]|nr:hypothetical protein NEUTE2DRAFT_126139 [Neurospora tetrasperma FGSC 2509]